MADIAATAHLFHPLQLRELRLRNRLAVSPMCQYSAVDGLANDFHLVHLGRFALGGFGLVVVEATGVAPEGRITPGDLGIWSDDHVEPLKRIVAFLEQHGAAPAIQLAHAGPKASTRRPWQGGGPLDADDAARGEAPWQTVSASAEAAVPGWHVPHALTIEEISEVTEQFVAAARRARAAGFKAIELHCAHGYLMNAFLSPISNRRDDQYGGDLAGRMRLPLEIAERLRAEWPDELPLFVRVSAVDGDPDSGTTADDTVAFARELAARGVDVVDCSSGGVGRRYAHPEHYGYQVPYAARVRAEAGIATMAVGLVVDPEHAQAIVADGEADLVAMGRTALDDPDWPLHAQQALGAQPAGDPFGDWPQQARWALEARGPLLDRLGPWAQWAGGEEQPE
ncbi:NADH:flavin oxidoreductase/NADH oxidase [Conexibacter sp. JD483]|uniref:NADH:flavin oxidoreductase/NADH oxidase n=1 Tax=unclassified Conexibacter TaxID=2627773 RepID=UPI00272810B0|nr:MULTISPECIES: NADH:flavin oxidoreductase/NADH oxidase [unclassified Conexibacter]MDO8185261.1 NADH:flavin oxidoreductase/NADH oxidase [Conexibacter sp. CPCC 205706]MDO8198307.1 NADH:flavin oxidoreductase/NADH oxidase [Conexibacter sp. CPCC 205762]MDR9367732.1 NADH:flavin oxidoreductase/NADH oxidase [Conexibacter sp. JD483]